MSSSQVVAPSLKKVHLISKKFCHQVNEIFRPYKSSRSVKVSTRPYVDIPVFMSPPEDNTRLSFSVALPCEVCCA